MGCSDISGARGYADLPRAELGQDACKAVGFGLCSYGRVGLGPRVRWGQQILTRHRPEALKGLRDVAHF